MLAKDGGDAHRFLHALHDRCWLHGLGWHVIGRSGRLPERSLVDRAVGHGERLCLEARQSSIRRSNRIPASERWWLMVRPSSGADPGQVVKFGTSSEKPRPSAPRSPAAQQTSARTI